MDIMKYFQQYSTALIYYPLTQILDGIRINFTFPQRKNLMEIDQIRL